MHTRLLPTARRVLLALCVLAPCGWSQDAPPASGGAARPGPFAVGFRSTWVLDRGRTYDARAIIPDAPAGGPRPVLVNEWYPASSGGKAQPMPYGDYFAIRSEEPALTALSEALAEYALDVFAEQLLGAKLAHLDGDRRARLDALLAAPTACRRDAAPAEGRFPVVIYHAGYGSSFEDDALLCELLASHGYLVLGSAFQAADGRSFNIDSREGSIDDAEHLLRVAAERPEADWRSVAVVGHSGGAHLAMRWAAQAGNPLDAVVSLDTTQDYYGLSDPRWSHPAHVLASTGTVRMPLLVVASPQAWFSLIDRLVESDRIYFTLTGLTHNEFTSQGLLAAEQGTPARASAVRRGYEALNAFVLAFLDAKLKGEAGELDALAARYGATPVGGVEPHVERMPRGASAPPPYDPESGPITPRQLRPFLAEQGAAETLGLLEFLHEEQPEAPFFEPDFGFSLLHDLLAVGREADARVLAPFYARTCPGLASTCAWVADNSAGSDRQAFVRRCLEAALLLTPEDAALRQRLEAMPKGDDEPRDG